MLPRSNLAGLRNKKGGILWIVRFVVLDKTGSLSCSQYLLSICLRDVNEIKQVYSARTCESISREDQLRRETHSECGMHYSECQWSSWIKGKIKKAHYYSIPSPCFLSTVKWTASTALASTTVMFYFIMGKASRECSSTELSLSVRSFHCSDAKVTNIEKWFCEGAIIALVRLFKSSCRDIEGRRLGLVWS